MISGENDIMDLNVSLIKTKGILIIILFILILGVNVISATDCNIDLNDLGDVGDLNDLGDVGDLNDSGDVGDFDYNVSFFYDNLKEDGSNYSSFLLYLIDCGFYLDVNNSNFENNDFLLISSKNHTFKLYSGENYTVPIGGIYYVSFENRVDYYLGGICYPDVIYMVNGTYYLDEDYLSWLKYNQGLNASNFGSVVLNFTNKNILLNDVFEEDYNNFINLNSYSSGTSIYFPHELININYSNLPIYYNLDDYGWVSPIKKQIYGDCWSFAVISALESFLLKSENISYNFSNDFSENHLKNVMSSRGINGSSKFEGGNLFLALAYLLRWSGPINEINDPYNGTNYSYEYFSPLKHVQDVLFISSRYNSSDNNHIKEAILKHGAVATNMILDSNYVEGNTYYFPWEEIFHKSTSEVKNMISNMVSGHSVVIVGWDDSYSANAFKRTLKFFEDGEGICWNNISFVPKNNGAFIIKDSATGKLLYVSYEDPSLGWFGSFGGIGSFVFTNVENVTNYKSIYQSDNLGILAYKNFTNTSIVLSNMFISESNETIVAIGFYALQNTNCTIKIIVNNLCRFSKVYTDICAGYHTFDLDKNDYINLTQNDTFQIRIILNNNNYLVPFSSLQSSNLSYICLNNTWYFCPKLCIKAYTGFSSDVGMSSISSSDISMVYGDNKSLVAVLKDGSGNVIVGKQVILTILDKINSSRVLGKYSLVSDFNGKVIWKINLNIGNYRGIFSFGGDDNFTGSDKVVWITINKQSSSISSNYWCYYGDNLIITIKSGIKFLSRG